VEEAGRIGNGRGRAVKPARFDYVRAASVEEAIQALAAYGDDAKIIAGGQSLMPMINFRLVKPSVLVDINQIPGLEVIEDLGDRLRMGALARHRMTATDETLGRRLPLMRTVMHHVAHMTVRNRGTFCGSVCHADPSAEMPMIAQMFDGEVEIASPHGARVLPIAKFLVGSMTNALAPDEMVCGITLAPQTPSAGWAFEEFSRRHGDFAMAAIAVTFGADDEGAIRDARVGMTGVAETPIRSPGLEALIEGRRPDDGLLADVSDWLHANLTPNSDIHASADYRRNLAGVLAGRVIRRAYAGALDLRRDGHAG
jgi:CO/xanthine dehydrogenase FAD-binding subunit